MLCLCDSVLYGAGGAHLVSWETLIHLTPIPVNLRLLPITYEPGALVRRG